MSVQATRKNSRKKVEESADKVSNLKRLTPDEIFSFFTASIIKNRRTFTR